MLLRLINRTLMHSGIKIRKTSQKVKKLKIDSYSLNYAAISILRALETGEISTGTRMFFGENSVISGLGNEEFVQE
jgi:hypothetical protein